MNLYVGEYWVPFPSSEYGGTWAVIAENANECIDILISLEYNEGYESEIGYAVERAHCFELNPEKNYLPRVVDTFFT